MQIKYFVKRTTSRSCNDFHCKSCFGMLLKKHSPIAIFICTHKRIKLLLKCLQITVFEKMKCPGYKSRSLKYIYKKRTSNRNFHFQDFSTKTILCHLLHQRRDRPSQHLSKHASHQWNLMSYILTLRR